MNKTLRIALIALGVVAVGSLVFYAGSVSAQQGWFGTPAQSSTVPGPGAGYGRMMNDAYQYGMMQGYRMGSQGGYGMGGQMGGGPGGSGGPGGPGGRRGQAYGQGSVELELSAQEAQDIAQAFLDENQPGATAELAGRPGMRGFYNFHILEDGEWVGVLSVDGNSGDVIEHTGDCPMQNADCPWLDQESDGSAQ